MIEMNWRTVDWDNANRILQRMLVYYAEGIKPDQAPAVELERGFFETLHPYVEHAARYFAFRHDWPRIFGDSRDEISGELRQLCEQQLLTTLRRGGFKSGEIHKAYVWSILGSIRSHAWRGEIEHEALDDIAATQEDAGPTLDEELEGRELRRVPPWVRANIEQLFAPVKDQQRQRRQLLVFLHIPFIAHGGHDDWELALASGDLARLLRVSNGTITRDREDLADKFDVNANNRLAWFKASRISTRLDLAPDSAVVMCEPTPIPPAEEPNHNTTLPLIWCLLRLLQVDGIHERLKLQAIQDSDPDLFWEAAGYELRLALELNSIWAGDKVYLLELTYLGS